MDFGTLLYEAQKNERSAESRPNYYKTKFSPPKKVSKDRSKLSINVQKFLEKQNEDEKKKKEDDKKKLNELLILRNQDKKSVNRVNKMLKLTKSANKSVLDDEPGEMMADSSPSKKSKGGSFQPDEDDYGYTSQAASSLYDKLMDKYSAMPDSTPGFLKPKKSSVKNISDIKDRVKAALRKEEEDKLLPHKRKRKHKDSEGDHEERHRSDDEEERDRRHDKHRESERDRERDSEREKAKKKPMPPPMDFNELLKLAEKKQHEPVVVEKKEDKERKKERDREPERLMTKKERREYEAHVERRRRLMEQERDFEKQEKGKDSRGGGGGFKIPKKNKEGEKRSENEDIDKRSLEKTSHSSSSSSNSKALSREELVDKLKKPSSVWSAPCNLTPPKLKAKYPNSSSSTHRSSLHSRNSNDSPVRNGYHGSSNRHSSSERSSSSSSARKLPFKESSYSSKSDKYDKYHENSHRDRGDSRENDRDRERTREKSRGDSRDRDRTKEKSRGGEKSRADMERELLLEQFKIQQEAMKRLEEKLKQMEKRDVPSNSDDRRRKRSPSPPRYSEKKSSSDKYETSSDRYDKASDKRLSDRDKYTEKRHSSDRIPSKDKPRLNGERDRERFASSSSVSKINSKDRTPSKPGPDVRKDSGSGDRKVNGGASSEHKNGQISTPEKGKSRPTLNGRLKEDLMRQPPKQFPPPDMMKPKLFPPADVRRGPKKPVKRRIESDSEYDSELDDFIVDDNDAELDISEEISNIFGYDRRKYSKYDEEDDVAMESNFHRMEKEEYESTKAGILEDLEDIAKEKRLKALAAKRKAMKVKR